MNDKEFRAFLRAERLRYGISQERLAHLTGITRQYVNEIETGKSDAGRKLREKLARVLEQASYDKPLFLLIDYLRVRFLTTDVMKIMENLLHIRKTYMYHEDYAFYGYKEQYSFGDITLMASPDESRGVLLELKGKGCRQMETVLQMRQMDWYVFFTDCIEHGGIFKRLDLAINDVAGILDIPLLIEKCEKGEAIMRSRKWEMINSSLLTKKTGDESAETLYIGSRNSKQYFCLYQKNREQKDENFPIKNRFEIRMKDEKAGQAAEDLINFRNPEQTALSIINRQVQFIDKDKNDATNPMWEWFMGTGRKPMELEMRPERYTLDRTMKWLRRQAAPTIKAVELLDGLYHTNIMQRIIRTAELTEKHHVMIRQMSAEIEDVII